MATLFVHITVKPGLEAAFEGMARQLYATTHAHEPSIRRYEYWRSATPRTYYSLLSFDDYTGFLHHQASEHHETLTRDFRSMIDSVRFEWVDPVTGAAPLAPTVAQDAPADANALMREYAGRMPVEIQPWWHARDGA